ncbi:hypothetical protein SDC9_62909 [bioreactor metagenome]|uniref:Uncharacterized protein n=1 Tax=bioreactor metagenome TaxID=1076179 RepID=A0A644XL97_9ZZZZ
MTGANKLDMLMMIKMIKLTMATLFFFRRRQESAMKLREGAEIFSLSCILDSDADSKRSFVIVGIAEVLRNSFSLILIPLLLWRLGYEGR